jgi:hypothetical protein
MKNEEIGKKRKLKLKVKTKGKRENKCKAYRPQPDLVHLVFPNN